MTRTAHALPFAALALAACYVVPPPDYQAPPAAYPPPPAPQSYAPPAPPSPAPAYAPPPQTDWVSPPAPGYAPPAPGGIYVDLDVVPPADAAPSVDVFYDALAPYGHWEADPVYGRVWIPSSPGYQPYQDGYWQDTDYGFTWISNEPFGWAVCHYGRWAWRGRWVWIPNTVWGPAWVQWREADGYLGWAPLPPEGAPVAIPEERWRFVPAPYVTRVDVASVYVTADPRQVYRASRPLVRYTRTPRGEIFVAGPDPAQLRARYDVTVVPAPLPQRLSGRYQPDAWRDRQVREQRRREEEAQWQRWRDQQARQQADQRRLNEEQQRLDTQRRQFEDQQRRARDEAERSRVAAEQRRLEEQQRRLQEQQRAQQEQQRRFAEEQRRLQEAQRLEAQRRAQEVRQQEMGRQADEQRRLQEQQRQQQTQLEQQRRQADEQRRAQLASPTRAQPPPPPARTHGKNDQEKEKGKDGGRPSDEGSR